MAVLVPGFLFAQARIWRLAADAACGPRGRAGGKPPPARFCRSMRKHIHRFKGRRVELTGWICGYVVETGLLWQLYVFAENYGGFYLIFGINVETKTVQYCR